MNEHEWRNIWNKHFDRYIRATPRIGIFIASYFKGKVESILEIGGGSCRDSIFLAKKGFKVICSDFEKSIINKLSQNNDISNLCFKIENAFSLSFVDKSFDLTFHNGFLGLFSDNQIVQLIKEQKRVTKKYLLFFVHNKHNKKLHNIFKEKSKKDMLYNIRFFSEEELIDLINKSNIKYKKVFFKRCGGIIDILYKKDIKKIKNFLKPISYKVVPHLYQLQPIKITERIACIIEI